MVKSWWDEGEIYLSCVGRKIWERLARSKQIGYVAQSSGKCVEVCWKEKQWQKKTMSDAPS